MGYLELQFTFKHRASFIAEQSGGRVLVRSGDLPHEAGIGHRSRQQQHKTAAKSRSISRDRTSRVNQSLGADDSLEQTTGEKNNRKRIDNEASDDRK